MSTSEIVRGGSGLKSSQEGPRNCITLTFKKFTLYTANTVQSYTLYDATVTDTASVRLSKPVDYTTARVNQDANYGFGWLWCVDVGSSVVINIPLYGDVDNGGCGGAGTGVIWEISAPSPQFCCEHKTTLKKSVSE